MLALSLFASLHTFFSSTSEVPPAESTAGILETSPRSFQNEVPLGSVSSYTLSFKNGEAIAGTATLVQVDSALTNLYVDTNWPLVQVALLVGSCEEPSEEAFVFEPPASAITPIEVPKSLEEIFHPRVPYVMVVEDTVDTYCSEL